MQKQRSGFPFANRLREYSAGATARAFPQSCVANPNTEPGSYQLRAHPKFHKMILKDVSPILEMKIKKD